jgi:hypothetical protein
MVRPEVSALGVRELVVLSKDCDIYSCLRLVEKMQL